MIRSVTTSAGVTPVKPDDQDTKLQKAAGDLEGLFVQQLFKAMRNTVPQDEGIISGGSGEEMFTGLMDEHLAAETPKQSQSGIAEALYRQLRHRLPGGGSPVASGPTTDSLIR
jgi:flagellar protein FlgJ